MIFIRDCALRCVECDGELTFTRVQGLRSILRILLICPHCGAGNAVEREP